MQEKIMIMKQDFMFALVFYIQTYNGQMTFNMWTYNIYEHKLTS